MPRGSAAAAAAAVKIQKQTDPPPPPPPPSHRSGRGNYSLTVERHCAWRIEVRWGINLEIKPLPHKGRNQPALVKGADTEGHAAREYDRLCALALMKEGDPPIPYCSSRPTLSPRALVRRAAGRPVWCGRRAQRGHGHLVGNSGTFVGNRVQLSGSYIRQQRSFIRWQQSSFIRGVALHPPPAPHSLGELAHSPESLDARSLRAEQYNLFIWLP